VALVGGRPDESSLAGPEHLDAGYVAAYERKAGFDPAPDVADLRALGLGSSSTLVDLGAGTGTLTLAAAAVCARVVAVDISPAMVEALRAKVASANATNVECVEAGFLNYAHEGAPADVVYTRNALHHLPDFWKGIALRRVHAMLRPDGILRLRDLVFSFDLVDAEAAIEAWLDRSAVDDAGSGWTRTELETHLREEHSTFTWLLEPLLERAGFEIARRDYGTIGAYADYVCVRR